MFFASKMFANEYGGQGNPGHDAALAEESLRKQEQAENNNDFDNKIKMVHDNSFHSWLPAYLVYSRSSR